MAKELNTKLKDYEIKHQAKMYAIEKQSGGMDGLLILSTILLPLFAYGLVFLIDKFFISSGIKYLPIIFAGIILLTMLIILICHFIKKSKKLKSILKNIPEEDMAIFKVLVKCEVQKLDEDARERELRSLERQINLSQSMNSEYAIYKANEKEQRVMKQEREEAVDALKNINSNLEQIKNNQDKIEVYDVYNKKGNRVGKIEKK